MPSSIVRTCDMFLSVLFGVSLPGLARVAYFDGGGSRYVQSMFS
jgi:hypothetical protein